MVVPVRFTLAGRVATYGRIFLLGNMDVLVLSRKIGERILIGDHIAITVVKVGQGGVRIGVEAPREMAVVREELAIQLEQAEQQAIKAQAK